MATEVAVACTHQAVAQKCQLLDSNLNDFYAIFHKKDTASFGDKALERYSTLLIDEKFKNKYLWGRA